jgi:hypothetical protein
MTIIQNTIQAIGSRTLAGAIIALGLMGAGYAAWKLWELTGRAAEMLEREAGKPKHGDSE